MAATCTQCGAKLLDDVRFCTQCGADQTASFSEALTFVPSATTARPVDDAPESDTATNPVVAPPASVLDTRPTMAVKPEAPLEPVADPDDLPWPPPESPEPFPPRAYVPPPPEPLPVAPPLPPAMPPVPPWSAPEPSSRAPEAFPPPAVVPLPQATPAARPRVEFPPASARPALSQTARNLSFMGLLVWGLVGVASLGYLAWTQFGPGPSPTSTTDAAPPSDAPAPAPSAPAAPAPAVTPDAASGGAQSVFTGHTAAVTSVAVSRDQRHVLSGGGQGDCSVRIWDLSRGGQSGRFDGHGQDCSVLVASYTGTAGLAASAAGPTDFALRVWDPRTGGELRQLSGGDGLVFRAIAADGTRAIGQELGGPNGGSGFSLWDLDTGNRLSTVSARGLSAAFAFSPTGDHILTGGDSGQIAVWDAVTGSQLKVFPGHGAGIAVIAVAFAPNRRLLLTVGADQRAVLWDPETGAPFRSIDGVTSVAMADDSRTLAVGGPDGAIRVIDAIRGVEHARLTGHQGAVQALAWTPGGRGLVSGGADKTVRFWSIVPRS